MENISNDEKISLARDENTSSETLDKLAENIEDGVDKKLVLDNIVENSNSNAEALDAASNNTDEITEDFQLKILNHENVDVKTVDDIVNAEFEGGHGSSEVADAALNHEDLSSDSLQKIATNTSDTEILDRVADHQNADDQKVKLAIAENENTSPETLDKLSNDESNSVRGAVADNKNTSEETLDKLSNDNNEDVKDSAKNNIESRSEEKVEDLKVDTKESDIELSSDNTPKSKDEVKEQDSDNSKSEDKDVAKNEISEKDAVQGSVEKDEKSFYSDINVDTNQNSLDVAHDFIAEAAGKLIENGVDAMSDKFNDAVDKFKDAVADKVEESYDQRSESKEETKEEAKEDSKSEDKDFAKNEISEKDAVQGSVDKQQENEMSR